MSKIRSLRAALALAAPLAVLTPPVQANGLDELAQNVAGRITHHASRGTEAYIVEIVPSASITLTQMENFIENVKRLIEQSGVKARYEGGFWPSRITKLEGQEPIDVWEYTFRPSSSVNP